MPKKSSKKPSANRLITSIVVLCLVAVFLLVFRITSSDSTRYLFLLWNLFLAIIPLLFAWWLVDRLKTKPWLAPKQLLITAGWFLFLPNSFYLVTDFVHLRETFEASLLYDIVLFSSFAIVGLIIGYLSVLFIHRELEKRLGVKRSWQIIGLVFLACSFAIYLGRFTRWNTWDVLLKPTGLLFDVSDRVVNPSVHSQTYETTFIFFVFLTSVYWVIWETVKFVQVKKA